MNILVCVKQVPKEEDLKLDPETKTLIRPKTGVISEYDKYAMEMATRLKGSLGGKVTAITMGPPASADVLRYCLSVGADEVYLLSDRALGGADAYATVTALKAAKDYLEKKGDRFDLVLCGKQASDSDTSLVMPELAEALSYAQVTFAVDYQINDGRLCILRETDEGQVLYQIPDNTVVSVSKTNFPARYPNLKLKMQANRAEIPTLNVAELGVSPETVGVKGSRTTVGSSYFVSRDKNAVRVDGANSDEIAYTLVQLLQQSKLI